MLFFFTIHLKIKDNINLSKDEFDGEWNYKISPNDYIITNLIYYSSIGKFAYFGINLSYHFGEMKAEMNKAKRSIENDDVKQGGNNQ